MFSRMNSAALETTRSPTALEPSARPVAGIYHGAPLHWVGNGFHVSTYFPSSSLSFQRVSPFVLMDYGARKEFARLARGRRGVGWHPHRGFETVTLAWEGAVSHRDNAGHAGVIGPGDAQWMTAGAGIFHEEYHEEEFTRQGGWMHMMQLWVNLPKKDKAANPAYQAIVAAQIPNVAVERGSVRVIAGEFEGARGPAHTFTPITMLDAHLGAGARLAVPLTPSHNAVAVVAQGRMSAAGRVAASGDLVLFENHGARIELVVEQAAHVIVLAGEPIDEPVVQYGPFVMNTTDEIEQAMVDVELGRFGPIPA